jgi:F0F1-type ATP synthase assembly protein I
MLIIGWGADLLLGSSPWGIVAGIVLGSIIGFVQFFRITSRIFKPQNGAPDPNPLFHGKDLEK